ncbi:hypothetical protein FOMPIDRAFT_98082 [Fomitopsis schrenkii]|uniref:F-box domain-containing protein n=1 Tax=Fomitopsis schrenkii TaxID=2126942 RepID=S8DKC8_FOMSC|nr:hypothetical protein FOMPIDRAFT_98082 [Fomitopsis schrenkii]
MALFSMNDDVVLLVLAELAPQDARQLIMTSHAGYELFFLRQVDLTGQSGPTQTNAERMRKFCEFMLADPDRRIPYLRVLRLNGSTFAGPGTQSGTEICDGPTGAAALARESSSESPTASLTPSPRSLLWTLYVSTDSHEHANCSALSHGVPAAGFAPARRCGARSWIACNSIVIPVGTYRWHAG